MTLAGHSAGYFAALSLGFQSEVAPPAWVCMDMEPVSLKSDVAKCFPSFLQVLCEIHNRGRQWPSEPSLSSFGRRRATTCPAGCTSDMWKMQGRSFEQRARLGSWGGSG